MDKRSRDEPARTRSADEEPEITLTGGNMNAVVRRGDTVHRTAGPWTPTIHRLLDHLADAGIDCLPRPLGLDEQGREMLTYLPGIVPTYPLPSWVWTDRVLAETGALLARIHQASTTFDRSDAVWQLPAHEPDEVICLNDMAPYNMVFDDDHQLTNATYPVLKFIDGKIVKEDVPALTALNMRLRDDYTEDCAKGVERWNKIIEKEGVNFRLELSHVAFNRQVGEFKDMHATPKGIILSDADWAKARDNYLPSRDDLAFLDSLMKPCHAPGQYASWIAPPKVGIDGKTGDFEYVKIAA